MTSTTTRKCIDCRGYGETVIGVTSDPRDGTPVECATCQGYGIVPVADYTVECASAGEIILTWYARSLTLPEVLCQARDLLDLPRDLAEDRLDQYADANGMIVSGDHPRDPITDVSVIDTCGARIATY